MPVPAITHDRADVEPVPRGSELIGINAALHRPRIEAHVACDNEVPARPQVVAAAGIGGRNPVVRQVQQTWRNIIVHDDSLRPGPEIVKPSPSAAPDAENPVVRRVNRHSRRRGLPGAMRTGNEDAKADHVLVLTASVRDAAIIELPEILHLLCFLVVVERQFIVPLVEVPKPPAQVARLVPEPVHRPGVQFPGGTANRKAADGLQLFLRQVADKL